MGKSVSHRHLLNFDQLMWSIKRHVRDHLTLRRRPTSVWTRNHWSQTRTFNWNRVDSTVLFIYVVRAEVAAAVSRWNATIWHRQTSHSTTFPRRAPSAYSHSTGADPYIGTANSWSVRRLLESSIQVAAARCQNCFSYTLSMQCSMRTADWTVYMRMLAVPLAISISLARYFDFWLRSVEVKFVPGFSASATTHRFRRRTHVNFICDQIVFWTGGRRRISVDQKKVWFLFWF